MSHVRRWNRLTSPHGVCHVPKCAVSLSTTAASDSRRCWGVACDSMNSYTETFARRASSVTRVHRSSPQNTPSVVATEFAAQRKSHFRSNAIGSAFQRIPARQLIVGASERRHEQLELGQLTIEGGGDDRFGREVFLLAQHADGMHTTRILGISFDIARIVLLLRTIRPSRGPRAGSSCGSAR